MTATATKPATPAVEADDGPAGSRQRYSQLSTAARELQHIALCPLS